MKIFRFFGRRGGSRPAAPPVHLEDWAPGDHAECLQQGQWFDGGARPMPAGFGPQYGEVRVVAAATPSPFKDELWQLHFERYAPRNFAASAFRKVTPRADAAESADAAFIDQLHYRRVVLPEAAEVSAARFVLVHVMLPTAGIAVAGFAAVLGAWAILSAALGSSL